MKLNKYLLGLLIAPALVFTGCSEYEDTEIVSPQADAQALGANFSAATTTIVAHPDDTSFKLTLNRVNTEEAVTIPVTVVSCSEVTTGVKFCDQPTVFVFAAGEASASVKLNFNPACKFQKTYKMVLTIGDEKDHPYAAGTASTTVSFSRDFKWVALGQPVIIENNGWLGEDAGILVPVEWASNYKDDSGKMLFRLKAIYAYAGRTANTATGHIQFYLDEDYAPAGMFSADGYDPTSINTGVQQNKPTDPQAVYYNMDITSITGGTYDEDDKLEAPYVFTYDIFYGSTPTVDKAGVKATLDFNIKGIMEEE